MNLGRVRISPRVLGLGALFSGASLLAHILMGWSLAATLTTFVLLLALALLLLSRRAAPDKRAWVASLVRLGALAGLVATITYDASKYLLSQLDPSPYNPFEALRAFGTALLGSGQQDAAVFVAGGAFHLLNGVSFGVAFALLFPRPNILIGIAWGVFLELFQLSLYPGWLNVKFYAEFAQISALGHVIYGATLGWICAQGSKRLSTRRPPQGGST